VLLFQPWATELAATNAPTSLRVKRGIHERLQMPLLDLTPDLRAGGDELYLEADPVHLNARGNEIVGRRLFEAVNELTGP
jgi:lysophospholipase L1-like esterase